MVATSLWTVLALMGVHVVAHRLRFLDVIPRSRLLSMAGGMSVAYVFLRILPDLSRSQVLIGYRLGEALNVPRDPVYLVALAGLMVFYGLERLADRSRRRHRLEAGEDCPSAVVFWISIASYSVVNFAVGYLLVQPEAGGVRQMVLFFVAMALWFVVNDYGLRIQHKDHYRRVGRWVLSAAVLAGWLTSHFTRVSGLFFSLALAFVAGGVILNVLKEELPRERESRFWAFAAGAAGYAGLLLFV